MTRLPATALPGSIAANGAAEIGYPRTAYPGFSTGDVRSHGVGLHPDQRLASRWQNDHQAADAPAEADRAFVPAPDDPAGVQDPEPPSGEGFMDQPAWYGYGPYAPPPLMLNEVTLRDYTLREPGETWLVFSPSYSWSSEFYTVDLPGPHVQPPGEPSTDYPFQRRRLRQWSLDTSVYRGVTDHVEVFADLPVVLGYYERSDAGELVDTSAAGLGDITFGGKFLLCEDPCGEAATWLARVACRAPSGRKRDYLDSVDLGTGFWEVDVRLLGHRNYWSDVHGPVSLFGQVGYIARIGDTRAGVLVDPGDSFLWQFGAAMPLNRQLSASARLEGEWITQTSVDNDEVPDSRREPFRVRLELNRPLACGWFLAYFASLGMNEDASQYLFGIELTRMGFFGWHDAGCHDKGIVDASGEIVYQQQPIADPPAGPALPPDVESENEGPIARPAPPAQPNRRAPLSPAGQPVIYLP